MTAGCGKGERSNRQGCAALIRISVIAKHHGTRPICRAVSARIDDEFHQNALLAPDRMFVIRDQRSFADRPAAFQPRFRTVCIRLTAGGRRIRTIGPAKAAIAILAA
jgi:hypothetical protein